MKGFVSCLAPFASILCSPVHANVIIDFEGINTATLASEIPQGYGGLTWDNAEIFKNNLGGDLDGRVSGDWFGFVSAILAGGIFVLGYPSSRQAGGTS